jgi:hypothetical protein
MPANPRENRSEHVYERRQRWRLLNSVIVVALAKGECRELTAKPKTNFAATEAAGQRTGGIASL